MTISIPPYPGVPAILGNTYVGGIPNIVPVVADLVSPSLFYSGRPQWGLYRGGAPAIVFETFVSVDYRREFSISDYPLEDGGFETFNKVQVPFNVRARFSSGGTQASREALLQSVEYIAGDLNLYTVVTPDKVYDKVNVQRVDYSREATRNNGLIVIEIWLLEIRTRNVGVTTGSSSTNPGGVPSTPGDVTAPTTQYDLLIQPNTGPGAVTQPQLPSGASPFNDGYVSPFDARFQPFTPGQIRNDPARGFTVY